jgi:hypothetical protein
MEVLNNISKMCGRIKYIILLNKASFHSTRSQSASLDGRRRLTELKVRGVKWHES